MIIDERFMLDFRLNIYMVESFPAPPDALVAYERGLILLDRTGQGCIDKFIAENGLQPVIREATSSNTLDPNPAKRLILAAKDEASMSKVESSTTSVVLFMRDGTGHRVFNMFSWQDTGTLESIHAGSYEISFPTRQEAEEWASRQNQRDSGGWL